MQRGALKDARGYVAEASAIVRLPEHGRIVIQLCRLGLQIEALIAEQNRSEKYPDLENEPRRETLHDILVSARDEAGSRESQAHLATAEAEYGRCLLTRDATAWISATSQWEALARPLDIAYCALRWAETELDSRGSAKGAAEPLRRGYRLAVELGAMTLVQQARQLARRGRIPLEDGPTAPPPAGPLMKRTEIERLRITPREYDVLCELVNGGSNQEIADRLYISNRTVAVHVSNLLGKLGVSRRGQAAAAANRLGLIDE
jgi:DNA-binding CsgD family transcriptional regulator